MMSAAAPTTKERTATLHPGSAATTLEQNALRKKIVAAARCAWTVSAEVGVVSSKKIQLQ